MARPVALKNTVKAVAILGSTGSIGQSTLDVIRENPGRFRVVSLSAGRNLKLFKKQVVEFKPAAVSVLTKDAADEIKRDFPSLEAGFGVSGSEMVAAYKDVDITVSAIAGFAGFLPTYAAVKAGKTVALANKEALVSGGALIMAEVKRRNLNILPVDSEHSAIFQSLAGHRLSDVKRIILTASGGPFLREPLKKLKTVTPRRALKHPTWSMGKKVTIDSATLMNKGFEVIEASWLFDIPPESITVRIHPQSIVHSMVEYIDGSIVSQMGSSDMKVPIAYALSYPERLPAKKEPFEVAGKKLEFLKVDPRRFPCLSLAYRAMEIGGTAPSALNAADEVCVDMFLKGVLRFTDIHKVLCEVLARHVPGAVATVDDVVEGNRRGRESAVSIITKGKI